MTHAPLLRREGVSRRGRAYLLRPALDSDAGDLVALRDEVASEGELVAAVPGDRTVAEESLAIASLMHRGGLNLVVEADGRVVGQLTLWRRVGAHRSHVGELGMSIRASHRGEGLGRALLEAAIGWARAVRLRKLGLLVFPDNERALRLYRAAGFVEEGRQLAEIRMPSGDRDVILMALVLPDEPPGKGCILAPR